MPPLWKIMLSKLEAMLQVLVPPILAVTVTYNVSQKCTYTLLISMSQDIKSNFFTVHVFDLVSSCLDAYVSTTNWKFDNLFISSEAKVDAKLMQWPVVLALECSF